MKKFAAESTVVMAQFNEKLKEFFEKSATQAQEKGANKLSVWQLVAMLLAGFLRGLKDETGETAKETQNRRRKSRTVLPKIMARYARRIAPAEAIT